MTNEIIGGFSLQNSVNFLTSTHKASVKTFRKKSDTSMEISLVASKTQVNLFKVAAFFYSGMALLQLYVLVFTNKGIIELDFELFWSKLGINLFTLGIVSLIIGKETRKNHGAEHRVLNAHEHNDLSNVHKYSIVSNRCGANFCIIVMLNFLIFGGSHISYITMILSVLCYMYIEVVRNFLFKFTKPFQKHLFLHEPSEDLVNACVEAIVKLENYNPDNEKEIHLCK